MTNNTRRHELSARFRHGLLALSIFGLAACGASGNNNGEVSLPDETSQEQVVDTPTTDTVADNTSSLADSDKAAILGKYDYLDPQHIVPYQALVDAVVYWDQNKAKFKNQNYISIINFAQSSKEKRFYIIDMNSGSVWPIHVAHGKGSDPDHDGFATIFSNKSGSNASSLGYYMTAETYNGSHGYSLRLDGLSTTNSNVRARSIVIHGASYVQEASVIQGRSWGCPAVAMEFRDIVVKALKGGSLIYAVVDKGGTSRPTVSPTPTPTPSPITPPSDTGSGTAYKMSALAWETSAHPERQAWSQYLQTLVLNDWSTLLTGATDMKNFCPKYSSLSNNQKANAWAQLFVAMAKYESAYNPLSRMHETTMGTDPVTGRPVYSEGLLQLSYQDGRGYKFCKMDWSKDKNLSSTDPKKTILDPYINLHCGVGIMARQIANKGAIAVSSGAYWAVIKTNNSGNKLTSIKSIVGSLPFCN